MGPRQPRCAALDEAQEARGISRRPRAGTEPRRGSFAETEIGRLHVDAAERRTAGGKVQPFLAVDRVPKLLHVEIRDSARMADGAASMARAVEAFPHRARTVPTDHGARFADQPGRRNGATAACAPTPSTARPAPTAHRAPPSLDRRHGREDEPHP